MSEVEDPPRPPKASLHGRLFLLGLTGIVLVAAAAFATRFLRALHEQPDPPAGVRQILAGPFPAPSCNIVLIVLDALRADHVGCYGYDRDTTPNLDRLAASATVCLRNKSQSSVTPISMAFLFTGRLVPPWRIRKGYPTLAETFAAMGYKTIGIQTNPWLDTPFFSRGFEDFTALAPAGNVKDALANWARMPEARDNCFYSDSHAVLAAALGAIAALPPDRKFFLYLHLMEPHEPLLPRPEFDVFSPSPLDFAQKITVYGDFVQACESGDTATAAALKDKVVALYDGEIRQADFAVGAILDTLKAKGLYDDSIIIVTSDHGELFGDHGLARHANGLFEEHLRTPLIIKFPFQQRHSDFKGLSGHIDVMPTVLTALGFTDKQLQPFQLDGVPLHDLASNAPEISTAVLFRDLPVKLSVLAVEQDGFKLIVQTTADPADPAKETREIMLFHIARDPGETMRLERILPQKVAELAPLLPLRKLSLSDIEGLTDDLTQEQKDRLGAIGYLH